MMLNGFSTTVTRGSGISNQDSQVNPQSSHHIDQFTQSAISSANKNVQWLRAHTKSILRTANFPTELWYADLHKSEDVDKSWFTKDAVEAYAIWNPIEVLASGDSISRRSDSFGLRY